MLRKPSYIVIAAITGLMADAHIIKAQPPTAETLAPVLAAHRELQRLGREAGDALWPGFRPDTMPVVYALPTGSVLLGWRGQLPAEFAPLPAVQDAGYRSHREGANTAAMIDNRWLAFVGVDSLSRAETVGLAAHEVFHALARSVRREGRRFGRGENAFHVSRYPVFDVENAFELALETRLLAEALRETELARTQQRVREFLSVHAQRHARLDSVFAEYERAAELNEGLPQYIQTRATALASPERPSPTETVAERLVNLTRQHTRSIRLTYYETGSAKALLLDRLAGPDWKNSLVRDDLTLDDALQRVAGAPADLTLARSVRARYEASLLPEVTGSVERLKEIRRAQRDSLLNSPGILVVLTLGQRPMSVCMFDPQNTLQTPEGDLLHARWVRVCAENSFEAEFSNGAVQPRGVNEMRAPAGQETELKLEAAGRSLNLPDEGSITADDVSLVTANIKLHAARAELRRAGRTLWVRILER